MSRWRETPEWGAMINVLVREYYLTSVALDADPGNAQLIVERERIRGAIIDAALPCDHSEVKSTCPRCGLPS